MAGWIGAIAIVALIVWIAWRHPRVHSIILSVIISLALLGGLLQLLKI